MKIEVKEEIEVGEVHLLFDPNGGKEVVVRYVKFYGDIIEQLRFDNLKEAMEHITKQGE